MPYGKRPVKRNTRRPRKNRKNAKKRAYAPRRKQAVMKMLAPVVENRKYQLIQEDEPILLSNEHTVIVPDVWEKMQREDEYHSIGSQLTSRGFTGNTLFSKIVNHQQIIEFDAVSNIPYPVELEQIVGWFKTPYLTTEESAGLDHRNPQGVVFNHDMSNYIGRKIQNMLQEKFSSLDPKVVKVNFRKRYTIRGQDIDTVSGVPGNFETEVIRKPLRNTFTWKPNRKYHLRPATIADGNTAASYKPDDAQVYWTPSPVKNQDLWIPFIFYRFLNKDKFGKRRGDTSASPPEDPWVHDATAYPHLFHKQTHYFTDL